MFGALKNFFGGKQLDELRNLVSEINKLEPEVEKLSDAELKEKSLELKESFSKDAEPDFKYAFALAREAARRTLHQRPYDVQLMGGVVLYRGGVAEMMTGEGKTLAAVAPVYARALEGRGSHVVTVNEYLARRDAVWMGQIYRALGLSVSCLVPNAAYLYDPEWKVPAAQVKALDEKEDTTGSFLIQQDFLRPITRREAYLADITYGTNHEFGFDYLRDNLTYNPLEQAQRKPFFAVIDEVDSILIDEARTPLIISAPDAQSSEYYKVFARLVKNLEVDNDYTVDEKKRSVSIISAGIEKMEKALGVPNLYAPESLRLVHYLEESLRAHALYRKDKDYVVKDGQIIIVDEFTGRMLQGRRYNGGLHQAIEAKEGVLVKEESKTYAKISIQNYFRMYKHISGMTGTAQTSAEEFYKVYNLDVFSIPSNRPLAREDRSDVIYKDQEAKWRAVVRDVRTCYEKGQPVLLGTTSIEKNEHLSALLSQDGIPHEVLNAKNNEREGSIIAQAGRLKGVTVATNMAGRGVDIILGGNPPTKEEAEKVKELGGLHVIGTERHEARRIDNQLRGRAGRQGDRGSSQFYLALDDDLLRIFGGDRIRSMIERFDLPEDEPIQVGFISKAVAQAQSKVEGANFDMRKHLLEYDDVLNKQRSAVYKRRQEILESQGKAILPQLIFDAAAAGMEKTFIGMEQEPEGEASLKQACEESGIVDKDHPWPGMDLTKLREIITKRSVEVALQPNAYAKLLSILDMLWMNNLEDLEALSESVGLRAYGQKDPLVEYRQEAHRLYATFWDNFNSWVLGNIFKPEKSESNTSKETQVIHISNKGMRGADGKEAGRNDPCPCGSGKKYKKCHGS